MYSRGVAAPRGGVCASGVRRRGDRRGESGAPNAGTGVRRPGDDAARGCGGGGDAVTKPPGVVAARPCAGRATAAGGCAAMASGDSERSLELGDGVAKRLDGASRRPVSGRWLRG